MAASRRILRALILGAPGSGKGTISGRLVRDYRLQHLASGDLLRNQISSQTKVGLEAEKYLSTGQLVPDPVILSLISAELDKIKQSWLLDGFPRTLIQAKQLSKTQNIDVVLNLDVPFETIKERLVHRWIHEPSGRVYHTEWNPPKVMGKDDKTGEDLIQRDDDKPETVQRRLDLYNEMTKPLLDFYRQSGVLQTFHGTKTDVIYPKMQEFLEYFINAYIDKR